KDYSGKKYFAIGIIGLAIVNYIVLTAFSANMGMLVALATFISFVMAPVVGYMNLKNVMSKDLPGKFHPGKGLQYLTYAGILFLSLFALYYCWMILF
ncbi:MAG: divalent metal cation transporter, partial [Bacteroidia bacterium]|nr:divalent metal cation transporter [Bacteroidia bacterium]